MNFGHWNTSLKIQESIGTLILKVGAHLGVCMLIPSHFPTFPRTWNVILGLPSWPAPLQALALVANLRLGPWHYINRFDVHWRIGGRWNYVTSFFGSKDNAKGCKGGKHCCTRRTYIHKRVIDSIASHRSVDSVISTMKGNGDGIMWSKSGNKEKACSSKQRYISTKKYSNSKPWMNYESYGYRWKKTMINMWSRWKTWRVLLRKKTRLLKQGLFFNFDGMGSTNAWCNVGISKHILDQGHKYLFWA
jgi:hypothetical protein